MLRNLSLAFIFAASSLLAQQPGTAPNAQAPQTSATGIRPPIAVQPPQPVPANAPVVTIHGLCPAEKPTIGQKTDSCTIVLTRSQFEGMVHASNLTNMSFNPVALRSLANGYVTLLALADAGEKAGLEKDPRFQELMAVARTRALAESYHLYIEEKYATPSEAEIAEYYKENTSKYEVSQMQRIMIPKVNPLRSLDKPLEFEKKAHALADQLRERAAKGEDIFALQAEAYKTLAIKTMPPQIEMNPAQVRLLPKPVQADVDSLKPGEVTKVEIEPSGFNIYKLSSRKTLSLEEAKPQIVHDLAQKNIDAALKAVTVPVHTDFNEEFFSARGAARPPQLPGLPLRPGTKINVHGIPARTSAAGAASNSQGGPQSSSPK